MDVEGKKRLAEGNKVISTEGNYLFTEKRSAGIITYHKFITQRLQI